MRPYTLKWSIVGLIFIPSFPAWITHCLNVLYDLAGILQNIHLDRASHRGRVEGTALYCIMVQVTSEHYIASYTSRGHNVILHHIRVEGTALYCIIYVRVEGTALYCIMVQVTSELSDRTYLEVNSYQE